MFFAVSVAACGFFFKKKQFLVLSVATGAFFSKIMPLLGMIGPYHSTFQPYHAVMPPSDNVCLQCHRTSEQRCIQSTPFVAYSIPIRPHEGFLLLRGCHGGLGQF
jgi:hypothetical protein